MAFQEEDIKKQEGLLSFIQANPIYFRDWRTLLEEVPDRVRERNWDPLWRNELALEADTLTFEAISSRTSQPSRWYYIKVKNRHRQKIAYDCVAYLISIKNVTNGEQFPPFQIVEFKWRKLLRDITELAIIRGKDITPDYEVLELDIKEDLWEMNTIIKFAKISLNKNYVGSYALALVTSRLIPWDFEENEYLQRRVIAFKDENDPDSNLFFSQAYFYLSQTVLFQDRFEESRLLLQQALDLRSS